MISLQNMFQDDTVSEDTYKDIQNSAMQFDTAAGEVNRLTVSHEKLYDLLDQVRAREAGTVVESDRVSLEAIVSMESMGEVDPTVSMEGAIMDFLGKIWNAIKEAIKRMWEYLQEFYDKIFRNSTELKKRAMVLKDKLATVTPKQRKFITQNSAPLVQFSRLPDLLIGRAFDPGALATASKELGTILRKCVAVMGAYTEELDRLAGGNADKAALLQVLNSNHVAELGFPHHKVDGNLQIYETSMLPGGRTIHVEWQHDEALKASDPIACIRLTMRSLSVKLKGGLLAYLTGMNANEMAIRAMDFESLFPSVELVIHIAEFLETNQHLPRDFRRHVDQLFRGGDKLVDEITHIMSGRERVYESLRLSHESMAEDVDEATIKLTLEYYKHISEYLRKLTTMMLYYSFQMGAGLYSYASVSADAYRIGR
jgi:hypothetical protein